jgi:ribosomal protein L3 glutamine methyltransferase
VSRARRVAAPIGAPATTGEWIAAIAARFRAAKLFFGHGTSNADDEAAWLVVHALGIGFDALDAAYDRPVPAAAARRIERFAGKRIRTRAPLAYVLKEAWLDGLRFHVDERVIVPRSFIAELLRSRFRPWVKPRQRVQRLLDLCTGSGCLAILAARAFPEASVDAVDLSADALAVARRNVRDHALAGRIRLVRSDGFDALGEARYDVILSNPPYVDAKAMARLPDEYRREPEIALASGHDGLELTRRILAQAADHLSPNGVLVVEIGHNRRALERAFPRLPFAWAETSAGGDYVFVLTRDALSTSQPGPRVTPPPAARPRARSR